ncbi:MAG: hypothetical protein GAK43_01740 [Stenotrophomonas maltophilia]|nr:MAG: hypothetical protein GAK43_01740 [Stenotrophomonas maltophilia]
MQRTQRVTEPVFVDEVPLALLDQIQAQLSQILGPRFIVVLAGSGGRIGASHYHLAIQHTTTDLALETEGEVSPGFIEELYALAWQMRRMLESRELARMDASGPVRMLTWISDVNCPSELRTAAAELAPDSRLLTPRH